MLSLFDLDTSVAKKKFRLYGRTPTQLEENQKNIFSHALFQNKATFTSIISSISQKFHLKIRIFKISDLFQSSVILENVQLLRCDFN